MNKHEQLYCTARKELLAAVYALRTFRSYLCGQPVLLRMDNSAVSWLRQLKNPTGQVARWIQEFETYDLVVQHRAGLKHTNADALSRRPCKVCERQERLSAEAEAEIEQEPEEEPVPQHLVGNQTTAGANKESIVVRDIHSASTSHSSQLLLDGWSTEEVRNSQLQDDDICPLVTALETGSVRPRWDQVSSGRAALKTFWRNGTS